MQYEVTIMQHVAGSNPNTAYDSGSFSWIGVPYDERIYFKFEIPEQPVSSAILRLHDHYSRIPDDQDISYERVLSSWDSTLTYNSQPSLSDTYTQQPAVDGQWVELDVTDIVNEWVSGADNYGIRIHGQPVSQPTALANVNHSNPDLHPHLMAELAESSEETTGEGDNVGQTVKILDKNRTVQAILPGVSWEYTRVISGVSDISVTIPREAIKEFIPESNPVFGFLGPTQPSAKVEFDTEESKLSYAEIAAFLQIWHNEELKVTGRISKRTVNQTTVELSAYTEEILLEQNITPPQYGRVFDNQDIADVARSCLDGWQTLRVKDVSQWNAAIASDNVDTSTEPGLVLLSKGMDGKYNESGFITVRFLKSNIQGFKKWDRVRWSADNIGDLETTMQYSFNGGAFTAEITGALPDESGVELATTDADYVDVRINLRTSDTESEDPDGNEVGTTPVLFCVELIARTEGELSEGSIPASTGDTVKGISANSTTALDVLTQAAEEVGYEFVVVDGQLDLAETIGADKTDEFLLRQTTNMDIQELDDADGELVNVLTAYGNGQGINRLQVTLRDELSIGEYGLYPAVEDFDADTLVDLTTQATEYLNANNTPKINFAIRASFEDEPSFGIGDLVRVVDPDSGIVTSVRIKEETRSLSQGGVSVDLRLGRPSFNLSNVISFRPDLVKRERPLKPSGVFARGVTNGLLVGLAAPKDEWAYTECHISDTADFEPDTSTLRARGQQTRFDILNLPKNERYYCKMINVDREENRSDPSTEVSAVTGSISGTDIDFDVPGAPQWGSPPLQAETIVTTGNVRVMRNIIRFQSDLEFAKEILIFRSTDGTNFDLIATVDAGEDHYIDSKDIQSNILYYYKLFGSNTSGVRGVPSTTEQVTSSPPPGVGIPANAPTVIPGFRLMGITYLGTDNLRELQRYNVQYQVANADEDSETGEYSVPSSPSWGSAQLLDSPGRSKIITHAPLDLSKVYRYRYQAIDTEDSPSDWSNWSSAQLPLQVGSTDVAYRTLIAENIATSSITTNELILEDLALLPQTRESLPLTYDYDLSWARGLRIRADEYRRIFESRLDSFIDGELSSNREGRFPVFRNVNLIDWRNQAKSYQTAYHFMSIYVEIPTLVRFVPVIGFVLVSCAHRVFADFYSGNTLLGTKQVGFHETFETRRYRTYDLDVLAETRTFAVPDMDVVIRIEAKRESISGFSDSDRVATLRDGVIIRVYTNDTIVPMGMPF